MSGSSANDGPSFDKFSLPQSEIDQYVSEFGNNAVGGTDTRTALATLGIGKYGKGKSATQRYEVAGPGGVVGGGQDVQDFAKQFLGWYNNRINKTNEAQLISEKYKQDLKDRPGQNQTILTPRISTEAATIIGATKTLDMNKTVLG